MNVDEGDFLEHFGKKGMKWGVRNDEDGTGLNALDKAVLKKVDPNGRINSAALQAKYGSGSLGGSKVTKKSPVKTSEKNIDPPDKKRLTDGQKKST